MHIDCDKRQRLTQLLNFVAASYIYYKDHYSSEPTLLKQSMNENFHDFNRPIGVIISKDHIHSYS